MHLGILRIVTSCVFKETWLASHGAAAGESTTSHGDKKVKGQTRGGGAIFFKNIKIEC